MKDRSSLNPEWVVLPDERHQPATIEEIRAQRDELEVQVQTLTEMITGLVTGQISSWEVLMLMGHGNDHIEGKVREERSKRAARTRGRLSKVEPVVYYLRRDDRTVKIGTSRSIIGRLSAFHAQQTDVLAVEPGGQEVESSRHQQFSDDRIERTELFRLSDKLRDHIDHLRALAPNPIDTAMRLNRLGPYAGSSAA